MRIYVSRPLTDGAAACLAKLDATVDAHPSADTPPTRDEFLAGISGADAIIAMVTDRIDAEALDAAGPGLRIVANHAVGVDNIDMRAAAERGVVVTNTPGVLTEATADLAFGLIIATSRRMVEGDRLIRSGADWVWSPRMLVGLDLSAGAILGIVGFGRIGSAVARRAQAFGMRIVATGRRAAGEEALRLGVRQVELDELLETADVVSLHCPLTPETRHLIGRAELDRMRSRAILVNTARGPIVDEAALADALAEGTIAAAGLDVYEEEPRVHPKLLGLDNVVLLPHIGSAAGATRDHMGMVAIDNVTAVLAGRPPLNPVKP